VGGARPAQDTEIAAKISDGGISLFMCFVVSVYN
jgi:hypothetical protein